MTNWNPHQKPDPLVCPRMFCFHWLEKGNLHAPGLYESLEDALEHLQPITQDQCGCTFGLCIRLDANAGDYDWYEPCEPQFQQHNLPWFYFIANPSNLVDDLRDTYVRESEALWGKGHWEA